MRTSQFFLVAALATLSFMISYVLTPRADRIRDDLVYAVTVALPASLSSERVEPAQGSFPEAVLSIVRSLRRGEIPTIFRLVPVVGEPVDSPQPVPHSEVLVGVLESRGKPLFPPKEMMLIASARAVDTMLANLDAQRGGVIRFGDGSYLAVAPRYLSHDVGVSVGLSTPALPDLTLLEPASEAMIISFEPVMVGIAYADPPTSITRGAVAAIALSARQRASSLGHMLIFVKRVFSGDGASADFEENPSSIQRIMTADLAANHVLRYTAHVRGSILVSLQRVKSGAMVGLGGEGAGT